MAWAGGSHSIIKLLLSCTIFVSSLCNVDGSMTSAHQMAIRIPSKIWRAAASQHQEKIRSILKPGMTPLDHPLNVGMRKQYKKENNMEWVTALDPKNPVYNFLIEYYGLKGAKGVRKLCRWSPSPGLLMQSQPSNIESVNQLHELSAAYTQETIDAPTMYDSILLEGADENDFGSTIHLRGATLVDGEGVLYSPAAFYGKGDPSQKDSSIRLSSPFLWYKSILQQTLKADPILHCYGLHEWAMQYQPEGAPTPPSGKYQAHLPLRVSREVINETVERKGVSCTHVGKTTIHCTQYSKCYAHHSFQDALRFFAEDALPLNTFGGRLMRGDQAKLEQPACVHAHMDLLKLALKLTPFGDAQLLQSVLEVGLEARKLDVAASPYDASAYGVGVVPIDTAEGRNQYREDQIKLMKRVEPVRNSLLGAYSNLLRIAFDDSILELGKTRFPT